MNTLEIKVVFDNILFNGKPLYQIEATKSCLYICHNDRGAFHRTKDSEPGDGPMAHSLGRRSRNEALELLHRILRDNSYHLGFLARYARLKMQLPDNAILCCSETDKNEWKAYFEDAEAMAEMNDMYVLKLKSGVRMCMADFPPILEKAIPKGTMVVLVKDL